MPVQMRSQASLASLGCGRFAPLPAQGDTSCSLKQSKLEGVYTLPAEDDSSDGSFSEEGDVSSPVGENGAAQEEAPAAPALTPTHVAAGDDVAAAENAQAAAASAEPTPPSAQAMASAAPLSPTSPAPHPGISLDGESPAAEGHAAFNEEACRGPEEAAPEAAPTGTRLAVQGGQHQSTGETLEQAAPSLNPESDGSICGDIEMPSSVVGNESSSDESDGETGDPAPAGTNALDPVVQTQASPGPAELAAPETLALESHEGQSDTNVMVEPTLLLETMEVSMEVGEVDMEVGEVEMEVEEVQQSENLISTGSASPGRDTALPSAAPATLGDDSHHRGLLSTDVASEGGDRSALGTHAPSSIASEDKITRQHTRFTQSSPTSPQKREEPTVNEGEAVAVPNTCFPKTGGHSEEGAETEKATGATQTASAKIRAETAGAVVDLGSLPVQGLPEEVSSLKEFLTANPRAFDEWMRLIGLLEEKAQDVHIKIAYRAFLAEFPLCWGYWKRLADIEAKRGSEEALAVYEDAVKVALPCVDLWTHFSDAINKAAAEGLRTEVEVREHFERAADAVGLDWRSGPVWERYLDFEQASSDWPRLGALFRRVLSIPTETLSACRVRLRSLLLGDTCPPLDKLLDPEELKEFGGMDMFMLAIGRPPRPATMWDQKPADVGGVPAVIPSTGPSGGSDLEESATKTSGKRQETEPGELSDGEVSTEEPEPVSTPQTQAQVASSALTHTPVLGQPPLGTVPSQSASRGSSVSLDQRMMLLKDWYLEIREAQFKQTMADAKQLLYFEQHLQRPYFHNKPLSSVQLETWRRYLDFEEERQPRDQRRLHALYQRCLVAANNYMEFWLRYSAFLEAEAGPESARQLLATAAECGRLRGRPDALAASAELEEQCGRLTRARELLDGALHGFARGSVELVMQRAALELRAGDPSRCESLLRNYASKGSHMATRACLARYHARFCEDILHQPQRACEAMMQTWQEGCRDPWLLCELAQLILRADEGSADGGLDRAIALFEEALTPATAPYAPNEASVVWSAYSNLLLLRGAPLERLRCVKHQARGMAASAATAAGGRPGAACSSGENPARPWPGQEPPAKVARTTPSHS